MELCFEMGFFIFSAIWSAFFGCYKLSKAVFTQEEIGGLPSTKIPLFGINVLKLFSSSLILLESKLDYIFSLVQT
jgi:hypothetical protein